MKLKGVLILAAALIFGSSVADAHRYSRQRTGRSVSQQDRARYDYSGTRGRMGLGANPRHPEGPGNFSTPR